MYCLQMINVVLCKVASRDCTYEDETQSNLEKCIQSYEAEDEILPQTFDEQEKKN